MRPRPDSERYICSVEGCGYRTGSWANFQAHARNAHQKVVPSQEAVELECFVCGQTREGLTQLLTHFKTMHKFEDAEEPAAGTVERMMRGVNHYLRKMFYYPEFERWLKDHGRE